MSANSDATTLGEKSNRDELPQLHARRVPRPKPDVLTVSAALAPFNAITLPAPRLDCSMPLATALERRRSTREYAPQPISIEELSDVLWSALGINRPGGERTVPYWRHVMCINIYVAMAEGVWIYEPKSHGLLPFLVSDIRALTGVQDFVATAPIDLIYVALGDRMLDLTAEQRRLYASVDTAFIGENVYLWCASAGLATVFRGGFDADALGHALMLPPHQFVTFAQTVGHPRESQRI